MEYISRFVSGYMVRKQVSERLYQSFSGDSAYGIQLAAKEAAVAFRADLLSDLAEQRLPSCRGRNVCNRTGVIGVAWYPPTEEESADSQEHVIRARVTNPHMPQRLTTRSWAVRRHGLWGAYKKAADWRHRNVNQGAPMPLEEVSKRFEVLLGHYAELLSERDGRFLALMHALDELLEVGDAPDRVQRLVEEVRASTSAHARFDIGSRKAPL